MRKITGSAPWVCTFSLSHAHTLLQIIKQTHSFLLCSHLSCNQQTEGNFNIFTIYITLIQFPETHTPIHQEEKGLADYLRRAAVSPAALLLSNTILWTKELSQGDPSSKSLVRL